MNQEENIQFYKKQLESAKQMQELAMQHYNLAAQIQSETIEGILAIISKPQEGEVLLSTKESADFFGVSIDSILRWRKNGTITGYMIEGSVLYKKSELLQALKPIKVK